MIDLREIRNRAGSLGVDERSVRNDYVLNHVLAVVAERSKRLMFRGGTALARAYWPDYRLSEDLDFISGEGFEVGPLFKIVTDLASKRTGIELSFDPGRSVDGWMRSFVLFDEGKLQIDVNTHERAYLPPRALRLSLPYRDLGDRERNIEVVDLAEILGNKWHMLEEPGRKEPRDLFDIWAGLQRRVPFAEIARGHEAKYGYLPTVQPLKQAVDLSRLWEERLGHQLADLPAFEDVHADVASAFQAWRMEL